MDTKKENKKLGKKVIKFKNKHMVFWLNIFLFTS